MWNVLSPAAREPQNNRVRKRRFRPHVELLEDRCCPSGGGVQWSDPLDPTFGNGGTVLNNFGSSQQALTDVNVLSDGKLLTAGYVNGDFAAARYNADGTFDASFGSGGLATADFKGGVDRAYAVAIQPGSGGKILLAGQAYVNGAQFGVVRLNPSGTLDTTFGPKGSGGKVTASPDPRAANSAYSMAVLADGRFVLAGLTGSFGSIYSRTIALARFNANGTLDTTFGNKGTVLTSITAVTPSAFYDHAVRVALDASGRIDVSGVTAGYVGYVVARFTASGSLDTTFGAAHTGVVTTNLQSGNDVLGCALALQGDGKIVVGGMGPSGVVPNPTPAAVIRYNPDGSLDPTFDQDGIALAVWDVGPDQVSSAVAKALFVQPDGKILIAADGNRVSPQGDAIDYSDILLMRFNPDGSPDLSYGPTGTRAVATSLGYHAGISAMALQSDGRAVVVGEKNTDNPYLEYFALTRFTAVATSPSPVQVGSFAASSATVSAGSPLTLTAGGITTANAGATITKVAFYAVDSSGSELFLGYGTAHADGTWTLTFTVNLASGSYTLLAMAADSTGAVSDPVVLSLTVQ